MTLHQMQGVLRRALGAWKRRHSRALFLRWAERHLGASWGLARKASSLSVWFRAKRRSDALAQAETAVFLRHISGLLQRALREWGRRASWRVVQRRGNRRRRRSLFAGWRHAKDLSLRCCLAASSRRRQLRLQQCALAWRGWLLFSGERAWGRRSEGVARVCQLRALRLLLMGVWTEWKSLAAWWSTDQRVQGLVSAVESYEQALKEVDMERSALEHDKASLFACVNELQSKFSHLEAEHARTLEASGTWKAKWEEEQQRTHVTLTEGARQTQQLQHQLDTSLVTVHKLSKEVDAKNVIIATLQQRGQELLTELSGLDSRFKEREAQAAQSKGLAEQVEALMQEKSTYEMVVKELSASSSQTQHDYAGAQQRLQDTVNVLASERDDLAQRIETAATMFERFQKTVDDKHSAYRARMLVSFTARRSKQYRRHFFALWRQFFEFRAKVRECEWNLSLAKERVRKRLEQVSRSRTRACVLVSLRSWQWCSVDAAGARKLVLRAVGIHRRVWERERLARFFGAMVSHVGASLRILAPVFRKCKLMAFVRWLDYTGAQKWMKAKALKVVQRLMNRGLVEGFERWRDHVVEERQMKAKALKVVQRLMNRGLVEGFERWREHVVEERQMKAKALKVVQRLMNRSLAVAFECWADYTERGTDCTDARFQALERPSQAEMLICLFNTRMGNASRLKAFGAWSQRLRELQSCDNALRLFQCQNRWLESQRALATWIRAMADAHRYLRGIYHIATKLWHVWERALLAKHVCLWKQLAEMNRQWSELWREWASIVVKNTNTCKFLQALHKLNVRASSRVLHGEASDQRPSTRKELVDADGFNECFADSSLAEPTSVEGSETSTRSISGTLNDEQTNVHDQTAARETLRCQESTQRSSSTLASTDCGFPSASLEQQPMTSTFERLSKGTSPSQPLLSAYPHRTPLAAIQVLSQAEQIWEQVAKERRKMAPDLYARAAQTGDAMDGSLAPRRAWLNQVSVANPLLDSDLDLETPFRRPSIPLSSIFGSSKPSRQGVKYFHNGSSHAGERTASGSRASTTTPETVEVLGLALGASTRSGGGSLAHTTGEERPGYARVSGWGLGVAAAKSSGHGSDRDDEYYTDSAKRYFLSRGVDPRLR